MKTAIKSALTAARRAVAYWQMRSIEINLAAAIDVLPHINDTDTREHMQLSIKRMSRDLCRARGHYQSFLPPGQRRIWRFA